MKWIYYKDNPWEYMGIVGGVFYIKNIDGSWRKSINQPCYVHPKDIDSRFKWKELTEAEVMMELL